MYMIKNIGLENTHRIPVRYAHCKSVSTLTLMTPCFGLLDYLQSHCGELLAYANGIEVLLLA